MRVAVVDESLGYEEHGAHRALRHQERNFANFNDVADYVSARLVSRSGLTNPQKMLLVAETIHHFSDRGMTAEMIRKLVDATIIRETMIREEIAVWKAQQKRLAATAGVRRRIA